MNIQVAQVRSHPGLQRYAGNISWLLAEKALRMVVGLAVGFWVARHLGPSQFGLLSYAQNFVALVMAIAALGLDAVVVRELVKQEERRDTLLGSAFILKLAASLSMLLALVVLVQLTSNDQSTNVLILVTSLASVFHSFNVIDFYYQSKVSSKYVALASAVTLAASSVLKIGLILVNAPLVAFASTAIFDSLLMALILIYSYSHTTGSTPARWGFDWPASKGLLRDSWPLMLGGLSFALFSNVDSVMLKEFTTDHEVGIYSAAYRLATLWYFLPGVVLGTFVPAVIKAQADRSDYQRKTALVTRALVWFAAALALLVSLTGQPVIAASYGHDFREAAPVLVTLIWVNVLIFFNSAWNYWCVVEGRSHLVLIFHTATAVLNVLFNLMLIPRFGAQGAAYAIVLSLLASLLLFMAFDSRTRRLTLVALFLRDGRSE